jgi:hypothetical protein
MLTTALPSVRMLTHGGSTNRDRQGADMSDLVFSSL